MKYKYKSYAKINSYLNVMAKLDNGYHAINTHFQIIDLYDELEFIESDEIQVDSNEKIIKSNNSIIETIKWFNQKYKVNQKFKIKIKKLIPIGAGLGGGSSNAAISLQFLSKFHNIQIEEIDNNEIALSLGADVPVFKDKWSCHASGIGDILGKRSFNSSKYLLICPKIFVSSQNLYDSKYLKFQSNVNKEINSFLPTLIKENKEFEAFYNLLRDQLPFKTFGKLKLSGTGSTLFLENPSESEIETFNKKVNKNFRVFLTKGLEYYDFVSDWGVAKW